MTCINGCNKPKKTRGMCGACYQKWRYVNDPKYRAEAIRSAAERNKVRRQLDPEYKKRNNELNNKCFKERYKADEDFRKQEIAKTELRKERVRRATPKWANVEEIKQFYANKPKGFHVDHIVPLQGKNVSGLNVIWNLQYLEASKNLSKGNKF